MLAVLICLAHNLVQHGLTEPTTALDTKQVVFVQHMGHISTRRVLRMTTVVHVAAGNIPALRVVLEHSKHKLEMMPVLLARAIP